MTRGDMYMLKCVEGGWILEQFMPGHESEVFTDMEALITKLAFLIRGGSQ